MAYLRFICFCAPRGIQTLNPVGAAGLKPAVYLSSTTDALSVLNGNKKKLLVRFVSANSLVIIYVKLVCIYIYFRPVRRSPFAVRLFT